MKINGMIKKMKAELHAQTAYYQLVLYNFDAHSGWEATDQIEMNTVLEHYLKIHYTGDIYCIHCGRKTRKSFAQGYCYPCFSHLAQCDSCIMSPEKCHYQAGTCREPDWAEKNCMNDHFIYLANTATAKVGITRASQIPTRWIDQGATQALPVIKVSQRYYSGLMEVIFKQHISDRTVWQKMLKGEPEKIDLLLLKQQIMDKLKFQIATLQEQYHARDFQLLSEDQITQIKYPVVQYPHKVKSLNLDKTPLITGRLLGIKGQYLILDCGVINIRKHGGYQIELTIL